MKLSWFWAALFIPILASISLIYISCHHCTDFVSTFELLQYWTSSTSKLASLADLLKIPIAIAMLAIPAMALVASNHRSVQTAAQIKTTESQNVFSNYFAHRNEFNSLLESWERGNFKITDKAALYGKFFKNSPHSFSTDPRSDDGNNTILSIMRNFNELIVELNTLSRETSGLKDHCAHKLLRLMGNLSLVQRRLHIEEKGGREIEPQFRELTLDEKLPQNPGHTISLIKDLLETLKDFCYDPKSDLCPKLIGLTGSFTGEEKAFSQVLPGPTYE